MDQNKLYDATTAVIKVVKHLRLHGAILILFDAGDRTCVSFAANKDNISDIQKLTEEIHRRMAEGSIAVPPSLG